MGESAQEISDHLTVLVIAAKFPNTFQPWLSNIVGQVPYNGSDVIVACSQSDGRPYHDVVDRFQLDKKTYIVGSKATTRLVLAIKNIFLPWRWKASLRGYVKSAGNLHADKSYLIKKFIQLTQMHLIGKLDVDIIHCHSEPTGYAFLPLLKSLKRPIVVTFHGLPPAGVANVGGSARQAYAELADVILVNTEFARQQCLSLGYARNKIEIIPQGIDLNKFRFKPKRIRAGEPINILTVGRYDYFKGQEYAIRAAKLLVNRGLNIRYNLVGGGFYAKKLQSVIEELELQENVFLVGAKTGQDLLDIYYQSHIFIFPSIQEGMDSPVETQGVVIQEAQAMGVIVIGTDTGGIPECIDHGKTGFVVPQKDEKALADAVVDIVGLGDAVDSMYNKARENVEQNYCINTIGKRMLAIYQDVLRNRSHPT